ncbi:MAG: peptidylprolyl isomerase [Streptosporangiaceae bacterium]
MAGKKERQRQLARQRYQRRAMRRAEQAQRTRKWTIASLAVVVMLALGIGIPALAGAFSGGGKPAASGSAKSTSAASASASASPSTTTSAAPVAEPAHHCTYPANPPAARKVSFPPARPDYQAGYTAAIKTNRGTITIRLLNSKATCTVNSFVSLARQKYFNSTHCQRLTTVGYFVLQCGDPTGTGSGGPGYKFDDENLAGAKYTAGTVAMANSGANTNGSQFFLVYKNSLTLPASYTPFGTITGGLNIIQKVAKAGSDNSNGTGDGHPKEKVEIESVTIKKT